MKSVHQSTLCYFKQDDSIRAVNIHIKGKIEKVCQKNLDWLSMEQENTDIHNNQAEAFIFPIELRKKCSSAVCVSCEEMFLS